MFIRESFRIKGNGEEEEGERTSWRIGLVCGVTDTCI